MSTDLSTPHTLYLLDDNDDFRATAKWWLSGAGYDVIDFGDAQAAIDALAALDAAALTRACLLLDVRMPSMTGLQVHDVLIEHGITGAGAQPALPIIYMTGHGDVPLAVQAMEKGAITFLEKPFEDSALESALARAFEAGAQSQHTAAAEPDSAADDVPCPEYQRRHAQEGHAPQGDADGDHGAGNAECGEGVIDAARRRVFTYGMKQVF